MGQGLPPLSPATLPPRGGLALVWLPIAHKWGYGFPRHVHVSAEASMQQGCLVHLTGTPQTCPVAGLGGLKR